MKLSSMIKRRLFFFALIGISTLIMTAGVVPGATAATKGGTLIIGFEAEPTSLDAHHGGASVIDRQCNTPIYDALVDAKFDGSGVRPALAERWEISGEGKVYTFYLRKGVKFHDGTPFNAEAVKFNYDRILDKDNKYHKQASFALQRTGFLPRAHLPVMWRGWKRFRSSPT